MWGENKGSGHDTRCTWKTQEAMRMKGWATAGWPWHLCRAVTFFVSSVMLVNPLRVEKQWQGRLSKRSNFGWGGERQGRTSGLESGSQASCWTPRLMLGWTEFWEFLALRCFYNRDVQTDGQTQKRSCEGWECQKMRDAGKSIIQCQQESLLVPLSGLGGNAKDCSPWGHVSQQLQGIKPVTRRSKFTLSVHILYLAYYQDSFSS